MLQYRGGRGRERARARENIREKGRGEYRGQGCMYSWSPQSTVRGRMTRIQGKLGHVEKYSCNDPSSIICLPQCTASSSHFPSKAESSILFFSANFKKSAKICFYSVCTQIKANLLQVQLSRLKGVFASTVRRGGGDQVIGYWNASEVGLHKR